MQHLKHRHLGLLLFTLVVCLFPAQGGAASPLEQRIASILPKEAAWALVVIDLRTGKENAAMGPALERKLIPGSVVKILTAGAVLDRQAKGGRIDMGTSLLLDGVVSDGVLKGNLCLSGKGNAFLSGRDIGRMALELKAKGIRKVAGDIIADDSFFDTKGLKRTRTGPAHAPAGALGLDLHTVGLAAVPMAPGKAPAVMLEPLNDSVRTAVQARTTNTSTSTIKAVQLDDTGYKVSGNIPAHSGPVRWRFSLNDPALYAAETLKTLLVRSGIEVTGEAKRGNAPPGATRLATAAAPPLEKIIRDTLVNSLNVAADNLLLGLGAERYGAPGTLEKGTRALNEFLASLDLDATGADIRDGSGLLDGNRVTARFTARYLAAVSKKEWFPLFLEALPRTGMEGTLKNMGFRDERFRAKSGRLENAFALAGYGKDGKGREIAFAYIVNLPGAGAFNLESGGAEVMRFLSEMI